MKLFKEKIKKAFTTFKPFKETFYYFLEKNIFQCFIAY